MGVRTTASDPCVALYDSVSGWAFGPTHSEPGAADRFLDWWESHGDGQDLRELAPAELEKAFGDWRDQDPGKEC